jgi:hypothetical protein
MFKLILSGIIMALFAGLLGYYAGGETALVGGGIGFIISVGLGLLPLWIAIIAIIIFGLIYGRKIVSPGGS